MKLINFSVTNFRSITTAHRIIIGDTTVLVGKNNEGKSNLLKALDFSMTILQRFIQYKTLRASRYRYFNYLENQYDWVRDFPINLRNKSKIPYSSFRLEFSLNSAELDEFKRKIKSNLNGNLCIEIRIRKNNQPTIYISKKGKGYKTLNSKKFQIVEFIVEKISFNYIPAIRTQNQAISIIRNMLSSELEKLEDNQKYKQALADIKALQKPILNKLARNIKEPLIKFLPNINKVKIEISEDNRRSALRKDCDVIIDDGTPTNLDYKGDGVKSLVTLALLKSRSYTETSITAIEEPESHLHPGAIHQLANIIKTIAKTNQVIITTHNPLFVNRENLKSNIIIESNEAIVPKNLEAVRSVLGIKASDNLQNSDYVLVVEGEEDKNILQAVLPKINSDIKKSLDDHLLKIEVLGGSGNLSYKLSTLNNSLHSYHVFLDNDERGVNAFNKARMDNLIEDHQYTFANCPDMPESEIEDCLNANIYIPTIENKYGITLNCAQFKTNKKWTDRMKQIFQSQGKIWDSKKEKEIKALVSFCVINNPSVALNEHKRSSIDALTKSIMRMIRPDKSSED